MKHRPEIDGLRAVAVIPVILYHAGFSGWSGGFVGVDVFFVISGYLITTLIVQEMDEGRFSLTEFYFRRVRRILPALVVVTAVTAMAAWTIMLPTQLEGFARSLAAVALFGSNILFWSESGYFAMTSAEKPLLHTWSLAVEEQYYVLFPLALLVVVALGLRRQLFGAIALAALASFALSEWASHAYAEANFYLLPTRAWELLAGSLCALVLLRREPQRNDVLAALGLAGILLPVFFYDESTRFPSVYALPPVLGAALIVLFATPKSIVGRVLSHPAAVGVGLISYSAYLWHFPLFAFARIIEGGTPPTLVMLALAASSLVLAWATWRFVEQPMRRIRPSPAAMRRAFAAAAAVAAAFVGVGVYGARSNGFEYLWLATRGEETRRLYALVETALEERGAIGADEPCRFASDVLDGDVAARLTACFDAHGPAVAILGDSHSMNLFTAVTMHSAAPFVVAFSSGGCTPPSDGADCAYYQRVAELARERPDLFERVIYSQTGRFFFVDESGAEFDERRFWDKDEIPPLAADLDLVAQTVGYLEGFATAGVDVAWLGPRFEPWIDPHQLMELGCDPGAATVRPDVVRAFTRLDDALQAQAAHWREGGVEYVSEQALVRFDPELDFASCDALFWSDEDHWSWAGADRFGGRIVGALLD